MQTVYLLKCEVPTKLSPLYREFILASGSDMNLLRDYVEKQGGDFNTHRIDNVFSFEEVVAVIEREVSATNRVAEALYKVDK